MSLNAFSIRPATRADWPALSALLRTHALPVAGAQEHLPTFAVAVADGAVVGVAGAEVHGADALLRSVAVAPGWQGRGVGEALVGTLMAQARRRGLREVCLLTTTAEGWFTRFGFERRERASVPPALRASAEFQGACPDGAVLMGLSLAGTASPAVAGTTACGCGTATASPPAPAPPDAPAARPCCCA